MRDNPIVTSISIRPIGQVPFPAVVVDLGDSVDPMGFVRASQNMVDESNIPKKGKLEYKVIGRNLFDCFGQRLLGILTGDCLGFENVTSSFFPTV